MANFDFDQQYASNFAYTIIKEYPIQLIGQGLSVGGLFMGPLYFYYLVPFFALTNLHPIGGYIGSITLGLFTVAAYYFIGNKLFGYPAGLIAGYLRSISSAAIGTDWTMTPAYSSELAALITWFLFYQYYLGKLNTLPILFFVFGLYTSFHPILLPFYIVFLILVVIKRKLPDFKIALFSILAFIIPLVPLILFEYFHKFLELRILLSFAGGSQATDISRIIKHLEIIVSSLLNVVGTVNFPGQKLFAALIFLILILFIFKKSGFGKVSFHKVATVTTFIVFLVYYFLFPANVPEYYFLGLTTIITLYFTATLSLLKNKKALLFLILTVITLLNLKILINRWDNDNLITLSHKDLIVREIVKRQVENKPFYVSYISSPGWNSGFDYLFKLYGKEPQIKEVKQPIYTIVIPKYLSADSIDISSGGVGLILPD